MTETLLGRDVLLEDGLVVMPAGKNRRVIWVQCPTCGPQVPATAWNGNRGRYSTLFRVIESCVKQNPLICSACDQDAPYKEILIPIDVARRHDKCNVRCLDGKAFCACACRGRCHSEGKCTCKEVADDSAT